MDQAFWERIVPAVLATWRITHLLAYEDGPADLIVRFRRALGSGFFGGLVDCFQCLSLWVAAPIALYVTRSLPDLVFIWLALSGAACLLEQAARKPAIVELSSDSQHREEIES